MHMLAKLCTLDCEQLRDYYTNIFEQRGEVAVISRLDLTEAAELVRRSRKIFLAFQETREFEENFIKLKSKIPRTFFLRTAIPISTVKKAMIFVLHYILDKRTAARHVKQSLRKNASFKVFAVDMNDILMRLTDLGVLTTERRIKRRRVVNEIRPGVNEIRIDENVDTFFKAVFDEQNEQHTDFLQSYQIVYPGEIFGG